MKKKTIYIPILLAVVALALLAACNRHPFPNEIVVDESYVHPYGVEVPREQWADNGRTGRIVTKMQDGVTVTANYNAGVKEGDATYSHPYSDTVQKTETYTQGKMVKEVLHNVNGTPMKETILSEGTKKVITNWYEDGTPQSREEYQGPYLIKAEYYDKAHNLEASVNNGEGKRISRDAFGQIESMDLFTGGQVSTRTNYYPNGHPKVVAAYKNGVIDGERKTYLPGGEPQTIEIWTNGLQNGLTTVFQNGQKYAEVPYIKGKKQGIEKRYRDGSIVVQEISWRDNQRYGATVTYINSIPKTEYYLKDKPISKDFWEKKSIQ